jgi:hypothetical protein
MDMRVCLLLLPIMLVACENRGAAPVPAPTPHFSRDAESGETRAGIGVGGQRTELRSGARVPVVLPAGLAIYPGARVLGNTIVARGNTQRVLIEFETSDPVAKVMLFHRAQLQTAGASLTLDLYGAEAASIGGRTAAGGDFALTARRSAGRTIVELSASDPA